MRRALSAAVRTAARQHRAKHDMHVSPSATRRDMAYTPDADSQYLNINAAREARLEPVVEAFQKEWNQRRDIITMYAAQDPSPRALADFCVKVTPENRVEAVRDNATHVLNALTRRISRSLRGFRVLPDQVQSLESVREIGLMLMEALDTLHEFQLEHGNTIDTETRELAFQSMLKSLAHNNGLVGTGDAMPHLRRMLANARDAPYIDPWFFDHFVTNLLYNAVSFVVLGQHHFQLSNQKGPHHVGAFDTQLRPVALLRDCAFKTQTVCFSEMGVSPRIETNGNVNITFEYIEAHFRYILTEVLKNATHATVRHHRQVNGGALPKTGSKLPPVVVDVTEDDNDVVTVTVRDRGGGMPKAVFQNIWRFGFTTAHRKNLSLSGGKAASAHQGTGLAGWGFGLPRSQVYARYLGGNIQIKNEKGVGCDVVLTFPKAASQRAREHLSH